MLKRHRAGDILMRQGEASTSVILVRSGTVEVLRELGDSTVLLGTAGAGEFIGEMGVLDARPRSATVRADGDVEIELIEPAAFLERVSREPELAHKLLIRMSARLREVEDRLAEAHISMPDDPGLPSIQLAAATFAGKFYIGVEPIRVFQLPFVVGRDPGPGEQRGPIRVDLSVPEPEPYRLSIAHFRLELSDGRVAARDLDSSLGTIVNGIALGRDFSNDTAILADGDNLIAAGGAGSPFQFTITLS